MLRSIYNRSLLSCLVLGVLALALAPRQPATRPHQFLISQFYISESKSNGPPSPLLVVAGVNFYHRQKEFL